MSTHLFRGVDVMGVERLQAKAGVKKMAADFVSYQSFIANQVINNEAEVYGSRPNKIGIMNPYILWKVFIQSKKPINNLRVSNNMIEAINQYSEKSFNSSITETNLFSPDSVLFKPLDSKQIVKLCPEVQMKRVAMSSNTVMHAMANPNASPDIETGTYDLNHPKNFGEVAYVDISKTNDIPDPDSIRLTNDRRDFIGDVQQGASLDCWFMAALFSWAWWKKVPPKPTATNGVYTIPFHEYINSAWKTTNVAVKPTLPLNGSLQLVFAQKTPQLEIWPALYEKAYSEFKQLKYLTSAKNAVSGPSSPYNPSVPYDPDTGTFDPGDPLIALTNISRLLGTEKSNNTSTFPSIYYTEKLTNNPSGTTAYAVLEKCNYLSSLTPWLTAWPTVAWTFASGMGYFPSSGWPMNSVLAPSHSYSVLGRYLDATTQKKYIILRNPWGLSIDRATSPAVFKANMATGFWQPDNTFTPLTQINLANNDYGIFGLDNDAFNKYFKGFGWVRFSTVAQG